MEIHSAEFVKGVTGDDYMLSDDRPQVAFLGRSNVGKSSVINSLVNRNKLVRVSSNPGKTREANFYRVNEAFYFIDFPGYGYAKMSQQERDKIAKRILWYLQYCPVRPKVVVLVVDAQVGITPFDKEMIRILEAYSHTIMIIANKADRLTQAESAKILHAIATVVPHVPNIFLYSAKTKKGRGQILDKLGGLVGAVDNMVVTDI
jgi:GTP-binding protein